MERVRLAFLALTIILTTPDLSGRNQSVGGIISLYDISLFEENGKVGLKNDGGKILIPAEYEALGWSNRPLTVIDQVVGYKINGAWGLISTTNKILTEPQFVELNPAEGSFLIAQKRSALSQRLSYGVINTAGKEIIPFIYDALQLSNMRAIVMSRTGSRFLSGLTDLSHKIIIPLQYRRIHSLGSLRYAVENFDNKTAIFSGEGRQITPFAIDSISSFKRDFAIVYQGQQQGVINRDGQFIARPVYGEVQIASDGTVRIRDQHQIFLLRGDNSLVSQLEAEGVSALSADHYALQRAGKFQLTDNEFGVLHHDWFCSITPFEGGIAVFRKGARVGAISSAGEIVIPARYHALEMEPGGRYFRACIDTGGKNRWVIIDAKENQITGKHYEKIGPFNGKFYPVKSRGYWGALSASGQEIITCVHDSLLQESGDRVVVKFKGEYGIMNLEEHWVVTPQPNPLKLIDDRTYFEYEEGTTYLKTLGGGLIYFSDNPLEYIHGSIREQLPSGAHWVLNMDGLVIDRSNQPSQADQIFAESEGLRAIRKDGKFGFIDREGRLRIANRYEMVKPFSDGLAAIMIRGRWGYIDRHEHLVVQPVYDEVGGFSNGMTIVQQGGLTGLVDATGRIVLPLRYDEIVRNSHQRYLLRQGDLYGMANASGTIIIHPRYDMINDTGNGYAIVQRDGHYGVLTLGGVSTIPLIYDSLSYDRYHDQFTGIKKSVFRPVEKK